MTTTIRTRGDKKTWEEGVATSPRHPSEPEADARPPGQPAPRARVLPEQDDDDDLWNDVPV